MKSLIPVIYSKGVFKPLEKIKIPENTKLELATLVPFTLGEKPKEVLYWFKYTQAIFKKYHQKLPSGLKYQKKIRQESDRKINLKLKKLNG